MGCGGVCVEGACGACVDNGADAVAVEGGASVAVGCGSSRAVGGVGKWANVIMGSIANVGGGGGRAIAEGRYRDMCGEGVCGDCVDIGMDAAAVEGGASVAIECATR